MCATVMPQTSGRAKVARPNRAARPRARANCVEVNVQPDEEHQQQLAELGEEIRDVGMLRNDAEQMWPDQDAKQDVADAVRQSQSRAGPADRQHTEQQDGEARHRGKRDEGGRLGNGHVHLLCAAPHVGIIACSEPVPARHRPASY